MSALQYSIVGSGEDSFVTAFHPIWAQPQVASKSGHPNFDAIVDALRDGADDLSLLADLFDVSRAVAAHFENLSDRVAVGNGRVLFDGAEVDNSLTKQIVRFLDEDVEDWQPLVNFMENVMDNPQPHSREQLFAWLNARDFTITPEGYIVAYKGVQADDNGGYRSISSGTETVYVDGVPNKGQIPNPVGAVINMDRGLVQHDPAVGCHRGLHVGTFNYAESFSRGAVLEVHVNPRDVVSVPTEVTSFDPTVAAKMRTCRYEVVDVIDTPYTSAFLDPDGDDLDEQSWAWDFDSEDIGDGDELW